MNNHQSVFVVSEATFDRDVVERSYDVPVVVDFWAPWCGPCRMLGPILEKLASEHGSGFVLAKLNVDDNQSLAVYYGVQGIPAVKAFRNGEVVDEFVGALPEPQVRAFVERLVPDEAQADLEQAAALLAAHRWPEAETLYRRLVEETEGETATLGLAQALLGQGKGCAAREALDELPDPDAIPEVEWLAPLVDYLCTMEATGAAEEGIPALEAQYRRAAGLIRRGNFAAALDGLLELLREDKEFAEGQARRAVLGIFTLLGDESELTRTYRPRLATILF